MSALKFLNAHKKNIKVNKSVMNPVAFMTCI